MSFGVSIYPTDTYAEEAAARIAESLPANGSVVVTGGTTAERVYPALAALGPNWSGIDVSFSDERCVPPDDDKSNFRMANDLLFEKARPRALHRMRGELTPDKAAAHYEEAIRPATERGIDLVLLGMGADCHVCALFPGSPGVTETTRLCIAVDRPDGLNGLSLTSPVLHRAAEVLLIVTGEGKAEAVRRAVHGDEEPSQCPARLLTDHANATFLVDEPAAALL